MTQMSAVAGELRACAGSPILVTWFGTCVRLYADEPVRAYIANQFAVAATGCDRPASLAVRTLELHVRSHPRLLDDLIDSGRRDGTRERRSFKTETYRQVQRDDLLVLLQDGGNPGHAFVGWDDGTWLAVSRGEPSGLVVTRLLRELIRDDLLDRDALMFHGAGARTRDGLGVFLVGDSGAGKTSASLRLAHGGGRVLGTDRVLVVPGDDGWWIVGLPTSTRLGAGAVRAFGILDRLKAQAPIRAINPFNPDLPEQTYAGMKEKKVSLANGEVLELLGTPFAPAASLNRVLVLQAGPHEVFRRESADPPSARHLLAEHLMDPDADYPDRWARRDPRPSGSGRAARLLDRFVADVRVERVVWSPPAHCDEQTVQRLTRRPQSGAGQP